MRVLIITKNFPPTIDGVGDYPYQLAVRLQEAGYEVHVLFAFNELLTSFSLPENISLHVSARGESLLRKMKNVITDIKPSYVLIQYVGYSFSKIGAPFWLASFNFRMLWKRVPVILIVHETFERRTDNLKYLTVGLIQRLCLKLLTVSSTYLLTTNKTYFRHIASAKTIIARAPSNFEAIKIQSSSLNQDLLTICSFGNRNYTRNLLLVKELHLQMPSIRYSIIGRLSASNLSDLKKLVSELQLEAIVTIKGQLPESEIIHELSLSDIFLLLEEVSPRGYGGLSTKSGSTATAFMLSKVVVSTRGDMTEDLFEDGINCILIDPENLAASAKKVLNVIRSPKTTREVQANAGELYKKYLAWEHTTRAISKKIKI